MFVFKVYVNIIIIILYIYNESIKNGREILGTQFIKWCILYGI